MLGRRYLAPTREETAVVVTGDGGESARAVVSSVAPLFSAADVKSLNLETVVGSFSDAEAYPKKRFLLQSPPETLDLLDELRTNLITLGNNHTRDWMDAGVVSTVDSLDQGGFPHVGGGVNVADARQYRILDAAGYRIGFLSYTSVNGDFVNDNLPLDADPEPPDLSPSEAWQYEFRTFGFTGASVNIPTADRRIGEIWSIFKQQVVATEAELADLWTQLDAVLPRAPGLGRPTRTRGSEPLRPLPRWNRTSMI